MEHYITFFFVKCPYDGVRGLYHIICDDLPESRDELMCIVSII